MGGAVHLRCSFFGTLFRKVNRIRREAPILFEVILALLILCIFLVMDIIWLGHVHTQEIQELDEMHSDDLMRFRKQFDNQMHGISEQHKQLGQELKSAHSAQVNQVKIDHQVDLEKRIQTIQDQLNGILGLSKTYWDKHANDHQVEVVFEPPGFQAPPE
uniref:Uncharacterized protein n=1 Tax=Ciona savignyi TaxID=51511 RepID=H2Y545_CIOSA